jgi:hypothetical protein
VKKRTHILCETLRICKSIETQRKLRFADIGGERSKAGKSMGFAK